MSQEHLHSLGQGHDDARRHGHGRAAADGHDHGDDHDHHHGHGIDDEHDDGVEIPIEENPIWLQDNVVLHSVGVDIGSAGTQVAFSRLHLRRLSEDLTSRYVVVRRETHYASEVQLTPFGDDGDLFIDPVELGRMLDTAYAEARVTPEQIDTGVVILTGEALRRRNAELIASVVSQRAGDLVCATAGHHMEAMLAAYGSGAVLASHREHSRVLNVDIGGGTTKLTLVEGGRISATAAFHVGGRLVAADRDGTVIRLEPGGARHARRAGIPVELGTRVGEHDLVAIADRMAEELLAVLRGEPPSEPDLWLTDPLPDLAPVDAVIFSGGVAEYVYGTEQRTFGDLGQRLGEALAAAGAAGGLPGPVVAADARIRATVLGASEYTVQLSGITSFISAPERTLPRRNLAVAQPHYELGASVDAAAVGEAIERHVERFGPGETGELAVALRWEGPPEYRRIRALGEAVVKGLASRISAGQPLYLMLDADIARTLGMLLRDELGVSNDLVVLDGVLLRDFDYVDLGRVRQPSGTVPVTIKSLVFSAMGPTPA
ncbi:ethanolamine ammonia-lyase reactivating factor EutA [Nocardioides sp. BP30]|uniref:ethanolamine ammonia-lyase reactivating factor EutA n=1 Tax=Nocardioides sp. BP30 TaxID=3036374 RepID=UPI002468CAE8|nr:ethanolamine ammonia-lyase reactivating factor EutA [Nocardioides sp. BP30]WGL52471.1 ethanolamine ammonia-lyase reactivating factor EutA [Nocardioides sp. BP30]